MARTKKLQQSQLELQAGGSAEGARQRSHDSKMGTRQQEKSRAESGRQFDASTEQRSLDRWQRQWEQKRAAKAASDRLDLDQQRLDESSRQFDAKSQQQQGQFDASSQQQQGQFDAKQQQQQQQFDVGSQQQQEQFDTSTDLSAASKGLMRGDAGGENPRLAELQAEMKRRDQQVGAGIEQTGQRGFVPTPESEQDRGRQAALAERDMAAKETNAAANYQRAITAHEKASADVRAAKTSGAKKEAEAKRKAVEQTLMQPIKSSSAMLDRFMKEKEGLNDWQALAAMIANPKTGVPPVGSGREIHAELEAKVIGPRITSFLTEKVAIQAIEFAYATGKMPDGGLVNFASEGMQEFAVRAREARQLLLPNTVAGQLLTEKQVNKIKRGYEDHVEMINKLAALLVLKQQPSGPLGATTGQEAPAYEHRRADSSQPIRPAERRGQVTPAEAGRQAEEAGGQAAPATRKQPHRQPESPDPYGDLPGLPGSLGGYQ